MIMVTCIWIRTYKGIEKQEHRVFTRIQLHVVRQTDQKRIT